MRCLQPCIPPTSPRRFWGAAIFLFALAGVAAAQSPPQQRPMDIVILKDESGSMRNTDSNDLRDQAVYMLADELELAGGANRVALVLFGTKADTKVGLTGDVSLLREEGNQHYPVASPPKDAFTSLERTPDVSFTDFYLALKEAVLLLESTDDGTDRDRYVVILTDGKIQPWPGHDRFAETRRQYFEEVLTQAAGVRQQASDKFSDQHCAGPDNVRIVEELLPKFRKNDWRIHSIGFSAGVSRDLLEVLAIETGGDVGVVNDAHDMAAVLDDMLPAFRNVIRFRDVDFCEKDFQDSVDMPAVGALTFRFNFSTRGSRILPNPDQVQIEVQGPAGRKYNFGDSPEFRMQRNRKGQLLQVSARIQGPSAGVWRVRVKGVGADPCGLLRIAAFRNQDVVLNLNPDTELHAPGSIVDVDARLESRGTMIPLAGARGELVRKGEGTIATVTFSEANADRYTARIKLPDYEEDLELRVQLLDAATGAAIAGKRTIRVKEQLCNVNFSPAKIDLGVVGGSVDRSEHRRLALTLDCPSPAEITITKPLLGRQGNELPVHWLRVDPLEGQYNPQAGEYVVNMWMELPSVLPPGIGDGEYSGQLTVRSPSFEQEYHEIPVAIRIEIPKMVIRPDVIDSGFEKQLSATVEKEFAIKVAGKGSYPIEVHYSPELYSRDTGSARVRMDLVDSRGNTLPPGGGRELVVRQDAPVQVTARIWIDDSLLRDEGILDEDTRVPSGLYDGQIVVFGDRLPESRVSVAAWVPESSLSMTIRNYLPLAIIVFGGLLVLWLVLGVVPMLTVYRARRCEIEDGEVVGAPFPVEVMELGNAARVSAEGEVEAGRNCDSIDEQSVESDGNSFGLFVTYKGRRYKAEFVKVGETWRAIIRLVEGIRYGFVVRLAAILAFLAGAILLVGIALRFTVGAVI